MIQTELMNRWLNTETEAANHAEEIIRKNWNGKPISLRVVEAVMELSAGQPSVTKTILRPLWRKTA